ncbi:uncharacterized protein LOC142974704 isoform X2 [Anticarsia gemmatalis]|uniref:uncharacterized protein LOC142974704 isoform X2 n=1 Tax=Anticarsia gemmatalis TaxID=129554 RepID=UPI003F76ACF1
MISNIDGTERLYLCKGDEPIYIENCKIPQHHIDGLRFLYKQYKKKKSGVIINYTSGYGRNLQVVLFLKALRHLFKQPVLVLCQEGAEHDWMEHFQTWTDLCDDVVLETSNPFIKKQVFINTMSNLSSFSRREWSVLVVDGDHSTHQILGLPFKAEYKIWITPVNMREHLDKFSLIYKWFYPKEKFDKAQFAADKSNPSDVVEKAVMLEAFMEDIVARRHEDEYYNDKEESPPIRISRKNKDATGTKIKRSKRRIPSDDDDTPLSHTRTDHKDIPTKSHERTKNTELTLSALQTNEIDDFSVDNFKRKSIEDFDEELLGEKDETVLKNSMNSQREVNLYYEPDSTEASDRLYEMDTLEFGNSQDQSPNGNEIRDIIDQENDDLERDRLRENLLDDDDDEEGNPDYHYNAKGVIPSKIFRNTNVEAKSKFEEFRKTNNSPSIFDGNSDNEGKDESDRETSKSPSIDEDSRPDINEVKRRESLSDDESTTKSTDNALKEVHLKSNAMLDGMKNDVSNEIPAVTNSLKRNCIEDKMKELEEKALKKFKGSILDSLF